MPSVIKLYVPDSAEVSLDTLTRTDTKFLINKPKKAFKLLTGCVPNAVAWQKTPAFGYDTDGTKEAYLSWEYAPSTNTTKLFMEFGQKNGSSYDRTVVDLSAANQQIWVDGNGGPLHYDSVNNVWAIIVHNATNGKARIIRVSNQAPYAIISEADINNSDANIRICLTSNSRMVVHNSVPYIVGMNSNRTWARLNLNTDAVDVVTANETAPSPLDWPGDWCPGANRYGYCLGVSADRKTLYNLVFDMDGNYQKVAVDFSQFAESGGWHGFSFGQALNGGTDVICSIFVPGGTIRLVAYDLLTGAILSSYDTGLTSTYAYGTAFAVSWMGTTGGKIVCPNLSIANLGERSLTIGYDPVTHAFVGTHVLEDVKNDWQYRIIYNSSENYVVNPIQKISDYWDFIDGTSGLQVDMTLDPDLLSIPYSVPDFGANLSAMGVLHIIARNNENQKVLCLFSEYEGGPLNGSYPDKDSIIKIASDEDAVAWPNKKHLHKVTKVTRVLSFPPGSAESGPGYMLTLELIS